MQVVGHVASLWRYPVKSMRGEELREVFAGFPGLYGDRAFAFVSSSARKGFPYFTAREQNQMLRFRAVYRHEERMALPPNLAEAEAIGTGLTPRYADPADQMVDVQTPAGDVLAVDDPRLIERLCEGVRAGHDLTLVRSERAQTDCRPVSIITLQTVRQLGEEAGAELDPRRFRANLYVDLANDAGFSEDAWVGRRIQNGSRALLAVIKRDQRCVMITLDPETGQANPEVMRRVAKGHDGAAGVYAAVLIEGVIRPGDSVALLD